MLQQKAINSWNFMLGKQVDPVENEGWTFYADSKNKTGWIATKRGNNFLINILIICFIIISKFLVFSGSHLSFPITVKSRVVLGYLLTYGTTFTKVNLWIDKTKEMKNNTLCKIQEKKRNESK